MNQDGFWGMFLGLFRVLKMVIYIKIYEEIPIFLLFSVQNSYFFPIFLDHESYFPIFFTLPATWCPDIEVMKGDAQLWGLSIKMWSKSVNPFILWCGKDDILCYTE